MLDSMIGAWNKFNQKGDDVFKGSSDEFSKGHWYLDVRKSGVWSPEFFMFITPALAANGCVWFVSAIDNEIILHIQ